MTEIKPVTYIHSQTLTEVTLPSKEHSGGARPRAFRGLANDDKGTCFDRWFDSWQSADRGRNSRLNPAAPPSGRVKGWRHSKSQVSIPCHVKRSVRISRTPPSCWLRAKGYETYRTGRAFGAQKYWTR
jgi:hypothetical protein